jgi:hypothetical protein
MAPKRSVFDAWYHKLAPAPFCATVDPGKTGPPPSDRHQADARCQAPRDGPVKLTAVWRHTFTWPRQGTQSVGNAVGEVLLHQDFALHAKSCAPEWPVPPEPGVLVGNVTSYSPPNPLAAPDGEVLVNGERWRDPSTASRTVPCKSTSLKAPARVRNTA